MEREARRLLAVSRLQRRAVPHLAAFFPDRTLAPSGTPLADPLLLLAAGRRVAARGGGLVVRAAESLWAAPRFGARHAPVALIVPSLASGRAGDPRKPMQLLRDYRVGGAAGLPEPTPAALGLPPRGCLVVLDPGRADRAAAAVALLRRAHGTAAGRPVVVALSPDAPRGASGVLPGGRRLPDRLAPWALIDLAALLYGVDEATCLLAAAAEVPAEDPHLPPGSAPARLAALVAATRCADPFRHRPWAIEDALRQLADWRVAAAENQRIVAAVGIEWFKHRALRAALSGPTGAPRILARGGAGLRVARRRGGALAVWAAAMPPDLPARAAAAGVPLVRVEDGFLRSAGLGATLAPALSLVLDPHGIHFDPDSGSALERLLREATFPPALLARAAALRAAVVAAGVTKYGLGGTAPVIRAPAGRAAILVPGQVEDDAAIVQGGAGLRRNLDLLRAVRAAEPAAWIAYKPHPEVAAGLRPGAIPPAAMPGLADQVIERAPIGPLYAQAAAVHTLSSTAGFEALLRGVPVVTWARPFYAGWGLTDDRDPPPGRGRALSLDALVAAALLLYPRYRDPGTGLPCPPERVLEVLATAPGAVMGSIRPGQALLARLSRRAARWWAAR